MSILDDIYLTLDLDGTVREIGIVVVEVLPLISPNTITGSFFLCFSNEGEFYFFVSKWFIRIVFIIFIDFYF